MADYTTGRVWLGRLPKGADLIEAVNEICARENIAIASVTGIGTVVRARIGFFDQRRRVFSFFETNGEMELTSLTGNVSQKDGKPSAHLHGVFSDQSGQTVGGHVADGTIMYSCECVITEYCGPELARTLDAETGLMLWQKK